MTLEELKETIVRLGMVEEKSEADVLDSNNLLDTIEFIDNLTIYNDIPTIQKLLLCIFMNTKQPPRLSDLLNRIG